MQIRDIGLQQADCLTKLNVLISQLYNSEEAQSYFTWYTCVENCIEASEDESLVNRCEEMLLYQGYLDTECSELVTLNCDCPAQPQTAVLDSCTVKALQYININLQNDLSNACNVLAYITSNFDCTEFEGTTPRDIPDPIDIDDDWKDDVDVNGPDDDGPYNEDDRKPIWWYHTDHLGSSTYLTDNFGRPSHYYETLPFGEMMVEHNQSSFYDNKYKFNGKELDDATGMYYYGARYYDPRISIFVSVDPLAEKTMEPYQYVSNNPIMLIDPDGMSPISVFVKAAAKLGIKRAGQSFVKNQIRNRLSAYASKAWGKQLLKDAGSFVDMTMNTSWWEYALEVVPVVGDAYGASKLGKQGYTLWKGLERFEAIAEIGVKASKNAWKKLGDSSDAIGKGSDKLKQYINKFNNQGTHLNADDLGGAVKEKFGLSSNGQHLKEATEALEGMGGQIGRLKSDIKNGVFEGDALKSAEGVLNSVEQQYNKINRTLNSADKQVNKLGKFE